MTYNELLALYKNNKFRAIDADQNSKKFYLLRTISRSKTLKDFCESIEKKESDLNSLLADDEITCEMIKNYINQKFQLKTDHQIHDIESELNRMENFDRWWSMWNSLEKNIVNNYVKKRLKYDEIVSDIKGPILNSTYWYTLNSRYNHWSTILIEDIFNKHSNIVPTLDLVEKIDFFIDGVPFDLKVTYFPDELMKQSIEDKLNEEYWSKSELTCTKRIAKQLNIAIPNWLANKPLLICLQKLLQESTNPIARNFINRVREIKKEIINYYKDHTTELMKWLYENQGEMRFDAANRFYLVLIDSENWYDSRKLKRNVRLLKQEINKKLDNFSSKKLTHVEFFWKQTSRTYDCISELLFITR